MICLSPDSRVFAFIGGQPACSTDTKRMSRRIKVNVAVGRRRPGAPGSRYRLRFSKPCPQIDADSRRSKAGPAQTRRRQPAVQICVDLWKVIVVSSLGCAESSCHPRLTVFKECLVHVQSSARDVNINQAAWSSDDLSFRLIRGQSVCVIKERRGLGVICVPGVAGTGRDAPVFTGARSTRKNPSVLCRVDKPAQAQPPAPMRGTIRSLRSRPSAKREITVSRQFAPVSANTTSPLRFSIIAAL